MSNRNYRYDDNLAEFSTPWDIARANGDDELADQLEAEANRALALRRGWPMPVIGLVFNEDEYPPIASEAEPQERRY